MVDPASNTVLVVDDDDLQRMLACDVLTDAGYSVVKANNAMAAIAVLESQPNISLLFTDIQMPHGPDGIALAQVVQERWPSVLLLLAFGGIKLLDEDVPDHGRFIAKPYTDNDMLGLVASLIERQHIEKLGQH